MRIIRKKTNQLLGWLYHDQKTYIKSVNKSKHLFGKLDAWGIDEKLFHDHLKKENYKILIQDKDENKTYQCYAEDYASFGQYLNFKGYGLQIFLPRKRFRIINEQSK